MNFELRCTLALSAVAYFVLLGGSLVSPILPLYALSFGVSMALVGALISGFGVASVFLDIPSGMVGDRIGLKRFMLYGIAIVFVSALICAFAIDYWMLLVGRLLGGVGAAMYTTTSFTCMGRVAPEHKRGKYMSFYLGMLLLGGVSGPALGGFVADAFGLAAPFFFYATFSLLSYLLIHFGLDEVAFKARPSRRGGFDLRQLRTLLRDYTQLSINLAIFAIFFLRMGVVATLVPLFASANLGMGIAAIGLILALSSFTNFVTMVPAGSLTDRYGRKHFMFSSLFLSGVLTILIPFTWDVASFAVVMALLGLAFGLSGPIIAWVTDITEESHLNTAMGLFRTMSDLGFVVGPVALALLLPSAGGLIGPLPFLVAAGLIILSSFLLLRGRDPRGERRMKRKVAETV